MTAASWGAPTHPVRSAVLRYAAGASLVLLVVVVAAVGVAGRVATVEALAQAERDARALAEQVVVPLAVDALDPGDDRRLLDEAFATRVDQGSLLRVKLWADLGDGRATIVYSDNRLFQGADVPLGEEYALFATGGASAQRVDEDDADAQVYPAGTYEVYVGFEDARGTPFLFEAYLPTPSTAIGRGELLRQWLPLVVGSLVLFALATMPLAVSLARRAGAAESERSRLARRALRESLGERRRLAQRLHDGAVQDLSGVGLALDSIDRATLGASDVALLDRAAAIVRREVGELRAVGDDLFPDAVTTDSLAAAVAELRRGAGGEGLEVGVRVDDDLRLDEDVTFLVYRVVREGLRNVVRHASATSARVEVRRVGDAVEVSVRDDGRGPGERVSSGLGLRLLSHEVRERGGTLELGPARPGAALVVTLPTA